MFPAILYVIAGAALIVKGTSGLTTEENDVKRVEPKAKTKPSSNANDDKLENSGFDSNRVCISGIPDQTTRNQESTLKEVKTNVSENNVVDSGDSSTGGSGS